MFKLPKRGLYTGRLAFDPDTCFHLADNGARVVTDDHGQTWRYAKRSDRTHNARYGLNPPKVLQATTEADPHHFAPLADDAHYHPDKPGNTLAILLPDVVAETVTSHTGAWKETA